MSTKELTPEQEFEQAFAAVSSDQAHVASTEPDLVEEPPKGEAETSQTQGGQAQADPEEDPFAALPQAVRDELAKVTRLQHELETQRRQVGQIGALQREIDRLGKLLPREAPVAQKLEKVERLRQDLPEFAEALDEVHQLVTAQRQEREAPPETQAEQTQGDSVIKEQMATLDELRPDWMQTFRSTDYLLWLGRQTPERQQEIKSTKRAAVILKSLDDFGTFVVGQRRPPAAQQRQDRMAAAAMPQASARRGQRAEPVDDEADFLAGFRSVSGSR